MALRDEYNVFVAARDEEYLRLTIYTDKDVVSLKFEIGEAPKFPVFRDEKMRKIYEQILLALSSIRRIFLWSFILRQSVSEFR